MPLPPNIQIDHLNVSLPPTWKGHAQLFARHLAHLLGQLEIDSDLRVDQLTLPPVTARPGETYQVVARRVARQVQTQLGKIARPRGSGETFSSGSFVPTPSSDPVIPFPSNPPSPHA